MAWRITTWWKRCIEGLRAGAVFQFVSHDFANFHWTWRFVLFVCWCVVWVSLVFVCVFGLLRFSSENSAVNSRFILSNFQLLTDNVSYSIGNGNAGKKNLALKPPWHQKFGPCFGNRKLGRNVGRRSRTGETVRRNCGK